VATRPNVQRARKVVVKALQVESDAATAIVVAARAYGPLWALQHVASGDLGGPLARAITRRVPFTPRSSFELRIFALVGPPLIGWGLLALMNSRVRTGSQIVEILVTALCVFLAAGAVYALYLLAKVRTRRTSLRYVFSWSFDDRCFWCGLLLCLPIVCFGVVGTFLIQQHLVVAHGVSARTDDLAYKTFSAYTWNLAAMIPVLEVPKTLSWNEPLQFSNLAGRATVLVFKVLLILPLIQLGTAALAWLFGARAQDD
jgi:hypothetical protein